MYESLINKYENWVKQLAHYYKKYGAEFEDLVQEGYIGLIKAHNKDHFSKDKGCFITFATPYIKEKMRTCCNRNHIVNESRVFSWKSGKLQRIIDNYIKIHNEKPSLEKLSLLSGFSKKSIKKINKYKTHSKISLNAPLSENDNKEHLDMITMSSSESPAITAEINDLFKQSIKAINNLSKNDQLIIKHRYIYNKTLSEIANEVNMTPAGVKFRIERQLKNIKNILS